MSEKEKVEEKEETERSDWRETFGVRSDVLIDVVDRLEIRVGVNYYKNQYQLFIAKVTDKGFLRQFYALPSWIWEKIIPTLELKLEEIKDIEREDMTKKVLSEIEKLKAMGVDVEELLRKVES